MEGTGGSSQRGIGRTWPKRSSDEHEVSEEVAPSPYTGRQDQASYKTSCQWVPASPPSRNSNEADSGAAAHGRRWGAKKGGRTVRDGVDGAGIAGTACFSRGGAAIGPPQACGQLCLDELAAFAPKGEHLIDIGVNLGKYGQDDVAKQLCRAAAASVSHVILTGTDVSNTQKAEWLCKAWDGAAGVAKAHHVLGAEFAKFPTLRFTAGVHPNHLRSTDRNTLTALRSLADSRWCVAIGECGLDYERMGSTREVQLQWFRQQVELAVELEKPLFLHERERERGSPLGSAADLLQILHECKVEPSRACIHCFTGDPAQLKEYISKGFMVGLTGFVGMQRRGGRIREALRAGIVPLNQLVLETDSPYMMPDQCYIPSNVGVQARRMEPCGMPAVCRAAAECLGLPAEDVARATTANARRFFALP